MKKSHTHFLLITGLRDATMSIARFGIALLSAHTASAALDPRSLRPPLKYADAFKDMALSPIQMQPIGIVSSPYKERFGTPRQSVVTAQTAGASAQDGAILLADHISPETLKDLDGFSHIWIIASLHLNTGYAAATASVILVTLNVLSLFVRASRLPRAAGSRSSSLLAGHAT